MASLIIAIIMIVFVAIKWSEKKSYERRARYDTMMVESNVRSIKKHYTDRALEETLKESLRSVKDWDVVKAELREICDQIPECREFTLDHFPRKGNKACSEMALRLLMAHRGKMLTEEAECIAYESACFPPIGLPSQVDASDRYKRKMCKYLILWTEKELNKHGIPARLYLEHTTNSYNGRNDVIPAREYIDPTENGEVFDHIFGYRWRF